MKKEDGRKPVGLLIGGGAGFVVSLWWFDLEIRRTFQFVRIGSWGAFREHFAGKWHPWETTDRPQETIRLRA